MRLFLAGLLMTAALRADTPTLMPLPVKAENAAGALPIDAAFTVSATGPADARLQAALTRFIARVARQTGIIVTALKPVTGAATLHLELAGRGAEYPALGEDESYQLNVTPSGARIKANTVDSAL